MFRNINKKLKTFKLNNIKIEPLDYIFDEFRIGNWNLYYDYIKISYNRDLIVCNSYSYVIKEYNEIVGYFVCDYNINLDENTLIPKYEPKLVLLDFAIDHRAYVRFAKLLLNHLSKLAKHKNTCYIEIKKIPGFEYFYKVISRYFKIIEDETNYYIVLKWKSKTHFITNLNDQISYRNLMYLYGLKFRIYKNLCIYRNNDLKITVNRLNNTFNVQSKSINLNNVKIDDSNIDLIYFIIKKHLNKEEFNYNIDYYKGNLHIENDDEILLLQSFGKIVKDYKLLNKLYIKGINDVTCVYVDFDMNYLIYNEDIVSINIECYFEKRTLYLDSIKGNLKDTMIQLNKAKNFNNKFSDLIRFEFQMGNSFAGIKKFLILFDENLEIKSNGKKKNREFSNNEIINDLCNLYFYNWKSNYNENPNPNYDNCWIIKLIFNDETLEYKGLDDYPNTWFYLIKFISKYVELDLRLNQNN